MISRQGILSLVPVSFTVSTVRKGREGRRETLKETLEEYADNESYTVLRICSRFRVAGAESFRTDRIHYVIISESHGVFAVKEVQILKKLCCVGWEGKH